MRFTVGCVRMPILNNLTEDQRGGAARPIRLGLRLRFAARRCRREIAAATAATPLPFQCRVYDRPRICILFDGLRCCPPLIIESLPNNLASLGSVTTFVEL